MPKSTVHTVRNPASLGEWREHRSCCQKRLRPQNFVSALCDMPHPPCSCTLVGDGGAVDAAGTFWEQGGRRLLMFVLFPLSFSCAIYWYRGTTCTAKSACNCCLKFWDECIQPVTKRQWYVEWVQLLYKHDTYSHLCWHFHPPPAYFVC